MARDTVRISVVLPRAVADELRDLVPVRARSEFIARALAEKLARLRQVKVIREAAGAWSDENHPDLRTDADYEVWKRRMRAGLEARLNALELTPGAGGEDVPSG